MSVVGGRRGQRRLLVAFGAAMAVLAVVYVLGGTNPYTGVSIAASALAGIVGVAAILVGLWRFRPGLRWPWLMFATSLLLLTASRVVFGSLRLDARLGVFEARLLPIHLLSVAVFVTLVAGLLGLAWESGAPQPLSTIIDSAIVVLGAGLLAWVVIARPLTVGQDLAGREVAVRTAYVALDVLLLAVLARLLTTLRWSGSIALIAAGCASMLAYNAIFEFELPRGNPFGHASELLWLGPFAGLGAAALVPSMASMATRPRHLDGTGVPALVLVSLSALVPFGLLLGHPDLRPLSDTATQPVQIAAAVMLALVLCRLTLAAVALRRSLTQAEVVGAASTALVGATGPRAIELAVSDASRTLLGPPPSSIRLVGAGDAPTPVGAARSTGIEVGASQLRIPLDLPGDRPGAGPALLVSGPATAIATNRQPLSVVAAQTSLALARVRLTEEIIDTRRDQYFRALVHNSADVILILEEEGRIRYASPSAAKLFGSSTVDGQRLPDLLAPRDRKAARALLADLQRRAPEPNPPSVRADWRVTTAEVGAAGPTERWVEVSCVDLRAEDAVRGVVVTLRDVTEQRRLEERLTAQAQRDPLTGLGNRSLFISTVEQALTQATAQVPAAVLFMDLDDFKGINDRYGHVFGDAVLMETAERIRAAIAPGGLAARVGGDEFAILVRGQTEAEDVDAYAARIVTAMSRPVLVGGEVVLTGASVGVATTDDAHTSEDLLRQADLALYAAKGGGKHQCRRYHPGLIDPVAERLRRRSDLAEAMGSGGLLLRFQPIVELDDGRTVGFEALLGWRHPGRWREQPSRLIELARDPALAAEVGDWAARTAIEEAAGWREAAGPAAPYVSVTMSAGHLQSSGAVERIRQHLADCALPPDRLMVAISESTLRHDDDTLVPGLVALRELGVRIAVDDFGSSYARAADRNQLPVDVVRLDGHLTRATGGLGQDRDLLAGLVRLAGALRLDVVAKGVETDDEFSLARLVGCAYGQGRAFSRPLTPEAALAWVTGDGQVHPPVQSPG